METTKDKISQLRHLASQAGDNIVSSEGATVAPDPEQLVHLVAVQVRGLTHSYMVDTQNIRLIWDALEVLAEAIDARG
jgi:hypothetical protein